MNVTVVGTGYVGLVTGTCFAELGNQVMCVDIDEVKVAKMQAGEVPIYEPQLDALFERNIREGRLHFTTKLSEGMDESDVIFLALPTPSGEDGSADLSYVFGAADDIGALLDGKYTVIVDKSTVPIGTAHLVAERIAAKTTAEFDVVSNPEFLREGFAVSDFLKPDRIIVGTSSPKAREMMRTLYQPFVAGGSQLLIMDEGSAEMTKYAANSFLATKISFMNEIANICELVGADVDAVRVGIGADDRIGKRFLFPGVGYGGSCFPKDVAALRQIARQHQYDFAILDAVGRVNETQKKVLAGKLAAYYGGEIRGKRFALWGLAFKPDTDDVREAPALTLVRELTGMGAGINAYDPEATSNFKKAAGDNPLVSYADDMYSALAGADGLLIVTEWSEFASPDYDKMKRALKAPVIFDGRNMYSLDTMGGTGFYYSSIGRATVEPKAVRP